MTTRKKSKRPATRRTTTTREETIELDDNTSGAAEELGASAQQQVDVDVLDAIAELGDAAKLSVVKVWRETPGKPNAYCRTFNTQEFVKLGGLDLVRGQFGPGVYRFHVCRYIEGKGGGNRIVRNIAVEIAELPGQQPGMPAPATDIAAAIEKVFERISSMQLTQTIEMQKMVIEALSGSRQQQSDPTETLTAMIAGVSQLRELAGGGGGGDESSGVDRLLQGIELANKLGRKGGAANMVDVLLEAVKALPPAIEKLGEQQRRALPRPMNGEGAAMQQSVIDRVRPFLGMLLPPARRQANAELYADLLLDQIDEQQLDELVAFLERDDWTAVLVQLEPELGQHLAWLRSLKTAILAGIQPEPAGDALTPPKAAEDAAR